LKSVESLYYSGYKEVSTSNVKQEMEKYLEEDEKWDITSQKLGGRFKAFGLSSKKRGSGGMIYKIDIEKLRDIMNRYEVDTAEGQMQME